MCIQAFVPGLAQMHLHLQVQIQMPHLHLHLHLIALWWMHLHVHFHLIHPHLQLHMYLIQINLIGNHMQNKCESNGTVILLLHNVYLLVGFVWNKPQGDHYENL